MGTFFNIKIFFEINNIILKGNENSGSSQMMICLYPIVTLILSVFILHEHLTPFKFIGVVVMLAGAYMLTK